MCTCILIPKAIIKSISFRIMFSEEGYDFYFSPCKGVPCNGEQAGTIVDAVVSSYIVHTFISWFIAVNGLLYI